MREKRHKKWNQEYKQKQSLLFSLYYSFDLLTSRTEPLFLDLVFTYFPIMNNSGKFKEISSTNFCCIIPTRMIWYASSSHGNFNLQAINQISITLQKIFRRLFVSSEMFRIPDVVSVFPLLSSGAHPEIFHGRGGFLALELFLLHTLKTTFWMKDLTQGWILLWPFYQNQVTFFDFQKKVGEASPSPLVARLVFQQRNGIWEGLWQPKLSFISNCWCACKLERSLSVLNPTPKFGCSIDFSPWATSFKIRRDLVCVIFRNQYSLF